MSRSIKQERRLLSADELTLVEKTHHPVLGDLPDPELKDLRKLVRERRDRAQDIAARQRREMRGKAAPQGARPATGDCGMRKKHGVLAAALRRVNKETSRREAQAARLELISSARRALLLRQEAGLDPAHPQPGLRANAGFVPKNAPAYRLRNPAKIGAISQHNKNMQAKRDSR
ncbi:MAG TPA: hypothetical protein VFF88_09950 [Methylocella sp.]|nr:hypothetical protein [Methylocella sp.]